MHDNMYRRFQFRYLDIGLSVLQVTECQYMPFGLDPLPRPLLIGAAVLVVELADGFIPPPMEEGEFSLNYVKKSKQHYRKDDTCGRQGTQLRPEYRLFQKQWRWLSVSKTVKGISEKEKMWVLLDQDFNERKDTNGKVLYRYKSCVDKFPYIVEHDGKKVTVHLTEKRLLTHIPTLAAKKDTKSTECLKRPKP